MRQPDGTLDLGGVEAAAAHDEVHLDAGEDLGVGVGAFGVELDLAAAHVMTALLQNEDDIVGGAAAGAGQHQLHGAGGEIVAAAFGGAIHADEVAAAGVGDEAHGAGTHPLDVGFHDADSWCSCHGRDVYGAGTGWPAGLGCGHSRACRECFRSCVPLLPCGARWQGGYPPGHGCLGAAIMPGLAGRSTGCPGREHGNGGSVPDRSNALARRHACVPGWRRGFALVWKGCAGGMHAGGTRRKGAEAV